MFVVADALALPGELLGLATRITINFPWGSLLNGLLQGHPGLMQGLHAIGREETELDLLLNAGALAEAGWTFGSGVERVEVTLRNAGVVVNALTMLGANDLRRAPTTWGKRLACGRDPRAVRIEATLNSVAAIPRLTAA